MEMGGELDFELGGDKKILIEKFSKQFELVFPRQQWLLAKEATRREGETYGTDEEIQREFTRLFGQPKSRFIGSSDRLMAV
ncbi:hypothetical protein GUITHDRAFT_118506 [Guillardia theta CCMP2712]|uniref:Uncharacterized protein n=1 Tax=Guillardia theta (strain CCMP2712) TaxID=905079 RepID=L1IGT3_GUITC|nr:hypothetical protein GUITHDRAFT_118506 [Guillardia theta CCMP2712]EKX35267.1 hypothetical protein GUITHDRAFT_118506 [Guillardia theta CCMP2712]|eukprot:XP_005822247.1 hypothetical protein GUITHDRAFT_118506 [Guillardia theta CCMP2712]